jgi:hypothetical protein
VSKIFFLLCVGVNFILYGYTSFTLYECMSLSLFLFFFFDFIYRLGSKLVILDLLILITVFICLCMPVSGYHHFDDRNLYSRVWGNYMKVSSDEYYAYMFPATMAMIVGLKLPIFFRKRVEKDHEQYMIRAKQYLHNMQWQGLIMVGIGVFASFVQSYVPGVLAYIFFLLRYLMFVGVFYCLYSNLPNKRLILIAVFGVLIIRSIYAGMFGEMVYMGVMTIILMVLGRKTAFLTKLSIFVAGVFVILVIQSIKPSYRGQVWGGRAEGQEISVFTGLLKQKISNPFSLLQDERTLFLFYGRFNQGQIVSRVLQSVPARFPYAGGETIYLSLAASVVPRFLWLDKPEAGGVYNFKRFLGVTLRGYSIGLSPFGEAWGNFGQTGGIVFMFFFGLLFNFFFHWLLRITKDVPSLILWFPFLFFYAVQIESDVVTMLNSFVKAGIFAYIIYKIFPVFFKLKI